MSFFSSALQPGGYIIILAPFDMFQEWYKVLFISGFSLVEYSYILTKSWSTIRSRSWDTYPQNNSLFGVVAHYPGTHPSEFFPPIKMNPSHTESVDYFSVASLCSIQHTRSKFMKPHSRITVNSGELSVKMISAVLDIFCPIEGHFLDPFAGTTTTAVATWMKGRSSVMN